MTSCSKAVISHQSQYHVQTRRSLFESETTSYKNMGQVEVQGQAPAASLGEPPKAEVFCNSVN